MLVSQAARSLCLLLLGVASATSAADCEVPEFMARADVRGLGLAEVEGPRIEVSVYGFAEYPTACVTEETVFEAASLTKPVVAYLVMRLVDRGRLGLDDPLIELLPSLPLPPDDERTARVTVRMALAHATGLEGPGDRELSFVADPGETFRYYPAGYRLVQRIVEHIEGEPLETLARREVFGPLGMESSSLVFRENVLERIATRHRMLGDPIRRDRDPSQPANAAASLVTTPGDYGRFLRAMLTGEGLTSASRRAMLTAAVEVPETDGRVAWGAGWGLEPDRGTFFHWGHDGAARAFTIGLIDGDRAIASFANCFYGMAIAGDIAERLIPGDSPAVAWLGYAGWDAPRRIMRLSTARAFVESGPDLGMRTFERYGREYPELDMDNEAAFLSWILDARGKHEGRARLIAWRLQRQPGNTSLILERARSLRAFGDSAGAIDALAGAIPLADAETAGLLRSQIRWIEDELKMADPSRGDPPIAAGALAGAFGERRVSAQAGTLWYQRSDRPRVRLIWMHGTTYALEGLDSFRIRFEIENGRASRIIGLYEGGRTDESVRTGG